MNPKKCFIETMQIFIFDFILNSSKYVCVIHRIIQSAFLMWFNSGLRTLDPAVHRLNSMQNFLKSQSLSDIHLDEDNEDIGDVMHETEITVSHIKKCNTPLNVLVGILNQKRLYTLFSVHLSDIIKKFYQKFLQFA